MKITWIGHACFLLEGVEGRVITDPFDPEVPYDFPDQLTADVVSMSHSHFDHNAAHRVHGDPAILEATGHMEVRGISFVGIASHHDDQGGAERGPNIIYSFDLDGIQIAHLGDLGEALNDNQRSALSKVEVLLAPVGGIYTIDAHQAADLCAHLPNLRVVIPMHFKTDRIAEWPIDTVEPFEKIMDNVRRIGASQVEITRDLLPASTEVWILDHA